MNCLHHHPLLENRRVSRSPKSSRDLQKRGWDREAERLRSLEVDRELILRRCLNRQVGRLLAVEDAIHIGRSLPELVRPIGAEGEKAARDEKALEINRGQPVPCRARYDR